MVPRRKLLYDRQSHEWVRSQSLFNPEFLDPITDHALSPLDYIKHIYKGWCLLNDLACQDNSVCDTLLPSIEEGETLKDFTTSDFKSLIQKIRLGEVTWVGRNYRGSSSFSVGGRKWEALIEHCLSNYRTEIDAVNMVEALRGSIGSFNKHHAMVAEVISRWCPDTNTFLCQYNKLGISLWEFIDVSHLPFEGRLMEEYIPFNKHFEMLSSTFQRLF